jgi:hypothetical protein
MFKTNEQIIKGFINGATSGKVNNLKIDGDKLINYGTVIAQRTGEFFVVNRTKYSITTSKIQSMLLRNLNMNGKMVREVTGIEIGYAGNLNRLYLLQNA